MTRSFMANRVIEKKILSVSIGKQSRLLAVRNQIRMALDYLEVSRREQNRLIIALSELGRNALQYADGGELALFAFSEAGRRGVSFLLSDQGPGIPHLNEIVQGAYRFPPGRGLGIISARRLLDEFEIRTALGQGTEARGLLHVERLNTQKLEGSDLNRLHEMLALQPDLEEILVSLREKEQLIEQLTRELNATNEGLIALYREIDEKRLALSRVNRLKSAFLANMSHELRTPLHSILALSQILLDRIDGDLSSEQQRQVEMIQRSGEQLLKLIDDILDLSAIEAGKIRIQKGWVDLRKVVQEAIMSVEPLAQKKQLALTAEIPDPFPPVFSDETRVRQILLNLLCNAVKFTPSGKITVVLSAEKGEDGSEEVLISVQDTGIGISPKQLGSIFEPFHQEDHGSSRRYGGIGLGLSISKQLVERLGGRIWADSAVQKGSTFTFTLPLVKPKHPTLARGEKAPTQADDALRPTWREGM
jgi:signal transduction histidine kinase